MFNLLELKEIHKQLEVMLSDLADQKKSLGRIIQQTEIELLETMDRNKSLEIRVYDFIKAALDISESMIKSRSRKNEISVARHIFCYLLFSAGLHQTKIAALLSRDRTTVLNSIEVTRNTLMIYPDYKEVIEKGIELMKD